jgi:hypothetical protein
MYSPPFISLYCGEGRWGKVSCFFATEGSSEAQNQRKAKAQRIFWMLIRISSLMFLFLTLIRQKYRQLCLPARESGLFNSNKHMERRVTCADHLLSWKQICMSYLFQTAMDATCLRYSFPRDIRSTKRGLLKGPTVPGYIHKYFENFHVKTIWAQRILN